ncbi:MAG: hypothetical protein AB7O62_07670 [Pirellulales bacterium]
MARPRYTILDLFLLTALAAVTVACFRLQLGSWAADFGVRCLGTAAMIGAFVLIFRRLGWR